MRTGLLVFAVGAAALTLAACADGPGYYGPPSPLHVQRCLDRHPGYDPRTNLYPGPNGRLHVCRAPG